MALAPLFILAILAAAAVAAGSSTSTSEPSDDEPKPRPLDPRARVSEDLTLCRTPAASVSLLDSSALVRWVSCSDRTAQEVADLVLRLEQQASEFPAAGYQASASTVRQTWNRRLDAEDARARELTAAPAARRTPTRTTRTATTTSRTPANRSPSASTSRPSASTSTSTRAASTSTSALGSELERAEREHPGARARYDETMRDGTPSELRAAADWVEDHDRTFTEIPRALRRRASQLEASR